MNSTTTIADSRTHHTARAFEQYVSGRRSLPVGVVFALEDQVHLDAVLSIAAGSDIVIAPGGAASDDAGATVLGYTGSLGEPGDELTLAGRHTFELQDYLAAPFISIVGLTLVRQGSAAGLAAFLQDADTARRDGVFVDQLLSGLVLLDSRASFTDADGGAAELVRVHVGSDGTYRDGPDGLLLGRVGDGRTALDAAAHAGAGRGRAFARIVSPAHVDAELRARPWLSRYGTALEILRAGAGEGASLAVSGFGGHLVTALDDDASSVLAITHAHAPFLVTGEGADVTLIDPVSRRRFRLGRDAAMAVECLVATGDERLAVALFAAEADRTTDSAAAALREVNARFGSAGLDLLAFAGLAA